MKTDAHKEKIERKKAERALRKSRIDGKQVERFVGYYKGARARNGVGRKPKEIIISSENTGD